MSANQSHQNRIKGLNETFNYRRAKQHSGLAALAANVDPKLNPSGKAKFTGKPQVAPYTYLPGVQAAPDQNHAARLRAKPSQEVYFDGLLRMVQALQNPPSPY